MKAVRFLLAVVLYASFAGAAACAWYCSLTKFSGTLAVGLGREEEIAVAPATSTLRLETGQVWRSQPAARIPFKDTETAYEIFSRSTDYNAAQLPFPIKLDDIETVSAPAPSHFLATAGQPEIEISEASQVTLGGETYRINRIAKWSGLMRDPRGTPMAAVTLPGETTPVTLFLAPDVWQVYCGAGVPPADSSFITHHSSFLFSWRPADPDAARAAANAGLPGLESARWGVSDRGAINWFQSFTPGTGATLSNGDEVTLVAFDKERPAVAVAIEHGGAKNVVWVAANEGVEAAPVQFEHPAILPRVFTLHAWEDGRALVTAFRDGETVGQKELQAGQSFAGLRLDDVQSSAVYVSEKESKLWAAYIETASGEPIVLRQGQTVRIGDSLVEYKRVASPGVVNHTLSVAGEKIMLKPNRSVRIGHWRLRQSLDNPDPQRLAVLHVEHAPGKTAAKILALTGLAALVLRLIWRSRRKPSALEL